MEKTNTHSKYLSGISVWALAFGCEIGWGSFVMPGTTFLPEAGPVGSFIGLILAGIMGFIVCGNYSRMMQKYPEAGGSYIYIKHILGEDHAFLAAWSLVLAYVSIMWANAAAIVLLARYIIGDVLLWGFHYTIFGYDVWLGEMVVTAVIILVFGIVTTYFKRLADIIRTILAITLFLSVVGLFICILVNTGTADMFTPAFAEGKSGLIGILNVAVFAPFLFVGFETVTHTVMDVRFPVKRVFFYA